MDNAIRVTEQFYSLQGEGRYVGVPSVFLRLFGCNFRCKNFNRDPHEVIDGPNPDVAEVIRNLPTFFRDGEDIRDLPIVTSGCDSYAAIYPEFKEFSPIVALEDLASSLIALTPDKGFHKSLHMVVTGGEPLLWQKRFGSLGHSLFRRNHNVRIPYTFETNGTQLIDGLAFDELNQFGHIHFSVSPKLSVSGEKRSEAILGDVVYEYMDYGIVDLKFVVDSQDSVDEVEDILDNEYNMIYNDPRFGHVYLMPEGGTVEEYSKNRRLIADLVLARGYRYSPRLQNDIYKNSWGT